LFIYVRGNLDVITNCEITQVLSLNCDADGKTRLGPVNMKIIEEVVGISKRNVAFIAQKR